MGCEARARSVLTRITKAPSHESKFTPFLLIAPLGAPASSRPLATAIPGTAICGPPPPHPCRLEPRVPSSVEPNPRGTPGARTGTVRAQLWLPLPRRLGSTGKLYPPTPPGLNSAGFDARFRFSCGDQFAICEHIETQLVPFAIGGGAGGGTVRLRACGRQ